MKILAVFGIDVVRADTLGLVAKAQALVEAAQAAGLACDVAMLQRGVPQRWAAVPRAEPDPRWPTSRSRRALLGMLPRYLGQLSLKPYSAIWLRALPLNPIWMVFLQRARAAGCRIVIDLPTYPFAAEQSHVSARLLRGMDRLSRFWWRFQPDRVVTLSHHDRIWSAPTIQVSNGCPVPQPVAHSLPEVPTWVGVGQWAYWHGLDRLFRSLAQQANPVKLRLVGTGPARGELQELARKLMLDVDWLPALAGAPLREVLAEADVAVGTLAIHRKGVLRDQSLKHRLYASAGLPFVCTTRDEAWTGVDAVHHVSADDTVLPVAELSSFVERARLERPQLSQSLLKRAEELSWQRAYQPLFSYFLQQHS